MKQVGNVKSNAVWNPKNVRPDIPIDADMVDSAMEKFIRQKYELKTLSTGTPAAPAARQNTGSTGTGSWSEEPPPLPPKPAKRFGFNLRSASSTFHRPKQDKFTPPISPVFSGSDGSAGDETPHKSKPSQVFGMKITGVGNNFDAKLATLRDMGFDDNRRNSDVLKSTNGNVDRAVETLVRLGEGSKTSSRGPTPAPRTLTPVSMGSSGVNGISIDKTRPAEPKVSNNPWEVKEEIPQRAATQPLPQASMPARSQSADPTSNSWNPFLRQPEQPQPQQTLESSFQNLQVSQTGHPQPQSFQQPSAFQQTQQQFQSNPCQMQPPSNPWQVQPQPPQQSYVTETQYSQPQPFQQQPQPTGAPQYDQSSNPFLRTSRSQTFTPSNPWSSQSQSPAPMLQQPSPWTSQSQSPAPALQQQQSSNPFGLAPAAPWQQQNIFQQPSTSSPPPMFGQQEYFAQQQQPQQAQQMPNLQPTQPQPYGGGQSPFATQQTTQPQQTGMPQQQQQQFQQPQQFSQQYPPTQPARHDKSSILALYNMPQLAPQRPLQTLHEDSGPPPQEQQQFMPPQRSFTMPMQQQQQQSMNPFMSAGPPQTMTTQGVRHVSNESVDFVGMGASGRHSPDAFAGLSARYMR